MTIEDAIETLPINLVTARVSVSECELADIGDTAVQFGDGV
ncbi:MAG: hypothetical protein WBX25_02520 [Rhodomicrobium sp.]